LSCAELSVEKTTTRASIRNFINL